MIIFQKYEFYFIKYFNISYKSLSNNNLYKNIFNYLLQIFPIL